MGRVTNLAIEEGQRVTKGQFLLQIDPRNLSSAVNQTEASLAAARSTMEQLRVQAEDPGLGRAAERLGRRIALGLIGASLIGAGTALHLGNRPWAAAGAWVASAMVGFIAWGTLPNLRRR